MFSTFAMAPECWDMTENGGALPDVFWDELIRQMKAVWNWRAAHDGQVMPEEIFVKEFVNGESILEDGNGYKKYIRADIATPSVKPQDVGEIVDMRELLHEALTHSKRGYAVANNETKACIICKQEAHGDAIFDAACAYLKLQEPTQRRPHMPETVRDNLEHLETWFVNGTVDGLTKENCVTLLRWTRAAITEVERAYGGEKS